MRNMLWILLAVSSLSYSALSFAGCIAVGGPLTINGRDIIVHDDTPIGSLLDTFTIGLLQTYHCDDNNTKNMTTGGKLYGEFSTTIDGIRVYKTNVAGIGYSLGVQTMCRGGMIFPSKGWRDNIDNIAVCWFSHTWNQITHNFKVRIYKIGPTASGTVTKKQIGATILSYNNHNNWAEENPVFLNAFNVATTGNNSNQDNNNNSNQHNNNNIDKDNHHNHIWPNNGNNGMSHNTNNNNF
ncbi:MAG TPA: hypothetical protein ACHBZA_02095 [Arsenophonus apicola]|uniref:hypothetical protein n=1 Tax=Arsenophonus TaxID=637 RepID=UPI0015D83DEE|nr:MULTISPECIES: hypothetical protein [Arsenophonus]UBX28911.1 hypothetical protein LDL57_14230 [Arsenophonus apicola]